MSNFNEVEVAHEVLITVDKLSEIQTKIKLAIARAQKNQTVRIKIADEICLVVKDFSVKEVPQQITKATPAQS